nr:hypothetical protein [Tanacetum cinerariifolium]
MHVFDKALNWHKQFIKRFHENVTWERKLKFSQYSILIGSTTSSVTSTFPSFEVLKCYGGWKSVIDQNLLQVRMTQGPVMRILKLRD